MELKDRIAEVRKAAGLTQKEFGEKIGVAANTVTNYESGNRTPIDAVIISICREFDINAEWLRTGNGDIHPQKSQDEKMGDQFGKMYGVSSFRKDLIEFFLDLTDEECNQIEQFASKLIYQLSKEKMI